MTFDLCDNVHEEEVIIVYWFGQICRLRESHTPCLQISVQLPHSLTLANVEFIVPTFNLIEDIPLCFNIQNKIDSLFCQEHSNSI